MAATRGLYCPATNSKTRFMSRDFTLQSETRKFKFYFAFVQYLPVGGTNVLQSEFASGEGYTVVERARGEQGAIVTG